MTWRSIAIAAALTLACSTAAHAAPQTFNTALPIAKGESVVREQLFDRRAEDDPSTSDRDLKVRGSVTVLGHGVARDWAVFGVLPYVDKTLETSTPSGRVKRSVTGLADARVFARYTLIQNDARGRTFRIAPFFGVELPTGEDDERDGLGRMPAPLQLGSGSWDPFVGIVMTYQTLAYQLDAQASYKINTRANGFEFGDEARLDASFQYRLWTASLDDGSVPGYLYGVIEGNLIDRDENQSNGVDDPNSGGTSVFLSPGLQYVTKRWIVEGIVQLPVSQDLNGTALEDELNRPGFTGGCFV